MIILSLWLFGATCTPPNFLWQYDGFGAIQSYLWYHLGNLQIWSTPAGRYEELQNLYMQGL